MTTTTKATYTAELREQCGGSVTIGIEAADETEAAEIAKSELEDWVREGEYGDDGAAVSAGWTLYDQDGDEVDSGFLTVEIEPEHYVLIYRAGGDPDCDHDWTSEGEGGCDQNPGVWSTGGTSLVFASHCRICGLHKTEGITGSQRNPGDHDTVEYHQPDSWCAECQSEECECKATEGE